jgi:hypothetical protein
MPLLVAVALALTACGDDKDKEAMNKSCPAARPAMKTPPTLPGNFPNATGMTYTGVGKEGPTTVATGYIAQKIGPAHQTFSQAIKSTSGYTVTKEEQDVADSEVNFSGAGKSGQVKLLQTCRDRTQVTITIRPA